VNGFAVSSVNLAAALSASALIALAFAGCVTKSQAKAQARDAFVAGQQQAMTMSRMQQAQGPTVTVIGQVKNGVIPWTPDLTLARAIVAADYFGTSDPHQIYIVRNGKATSIDSKQLLNGDDVPVQPGDVIQIMQ
jgi:hypothetical protein